MRNPISSIFILIALFLFLSISTSYANRGIIPIPIKNKAGKQVGLYKESHALVIGVSDYTNGWPDLPGVRKDVGLIKTALEANGFHVVAKQDLDHNELENAFEEFINRYGHEPEARLLFYFSGHGHTLKLAYGGDMGYIVPTDAPNPNRDRIGFLNKALDMERMEVFAKKIESKHALFLFDSCFSGSIFSLSKAVPNNITYKTSEPVRQFITAGSANETVPDESIFGAQFIAALNGEGDTDQDGYLTGVELGEFLQKQVANYSNESQHPQYGKIRNPYLDKGDFVFQLKTEEKQVKVANLPPNKLPNREKKQIPIQTYSGLMFPLEPFIINLANSKGNKFLKLQVSLELSSPKVRKEVNENIQKISDSILILLSSKSFEDIYSVRGKFKLKDEIISRVNRFLVLGHVEEAYFKEFVIQTRLKALGKLKEKKQKQKRLDQSKRKIANKVGDRYTQALRRYSKLIQDKIYSHWEVPISKDIQKKITASFTLLRNGNIGDIKLLRSSGKENYDFLAVKAIKAAEPFPNSF